MNQHNSIRRNKYVANCLSLITLILSRASIPAHSRLAERWNSFASCIKRKSTLPIKHQLVDNRLSPSSNPTTDRCTRFVLLRARKCLQRHFQSGNSKDTTDKVQDLFSYSHEGAYRGTSRLGIQKTR